MRTFRTCIMKTESEKLVWAVFPCLQTPSYCVGPCGYGEWQAWCLLLNSLWHHPPQGALNHQPTGVTPTGRAEALRFLPWMTSDTPSLCLVALKRQWWGFLPSQAAGCNWCGRDVNSNLLLSDNLSVNPSSTQLWDLPHQPQQTATWSIRSTLPAPCFV